MASTCQTQTCDSKYPQTGQGGHQATTVSDMSNTTWALIEESRSIIVTPSLADRYYAGCLACAFSGNGKNGDYCDLGMQVKHSMKRL